MQKKYCLRQKKWRFLQAGKIQSFFRYDKQVVEVKNIYYTGYGENPSIIEGYSKERSIDNITFENIMINGKQAGILEDANIKVGKFVENVTFQ